jgi:hypothetical protein
VAAKVNFLGSSYSLALKKASIERTVGMYLVPLEGAEKGAVLQSVPGYTVFADLGSVVRGTLATNDRVFFVAGGSLYELDSNGVATNRGVLQTSSGVVEMAYGISQLVIVDGPNGYVLSLATNTFTQIDSPGFYGSETVCFSDNYFFFRRPGTGQFYISGINDATTEDPLDFATAESQPDDLVGIVAVQRRVILLGQTSTEVWFNSGAALFPFEREGTTIEVGCMAPHSVRAVDNSAFWVGQDRNGVGVVYRLNGYQAVRISNVAVEEALQASDVSEANAYCYQENGATFYALNAPGLTSTWVYEIRAGEWHERVDLDGVGQFTPDRAVCHSSAFGKHLLGASDGKVYALDSDVHQKAGDPLVRERISPYYDSMGWTFYGAFHLNCTTGETPQGEIPLVELSWTDNSGKSWSNPIVQELGRVGEKFAVLIWRMLGRSKHRAWKVRFTGNARFDIVDAQLESAQGRS